MYKGLYVRLFAFKNSRDNLNLLHSYPLRIIRVGFLLGLEILHLQRLKRFK
jgi:hypothetical protein